MTTGARSGTPSSRSAVCAPAPALVVVVDACEARAIAAPHHLFEEREQPAIGAQMQVGREDDARRALQV